jgi:DUF4097 and DUF4098 domain-containing protein YvlB
LSQDSSISVISGDIHLDVNGNKDNYNVFFTSVSGEIDLFNLGVFPNYSDIQNLDKTTLKIKTTSGSARIY